MTSASTPPPAGVAEWPHAPRHSVGAHGIYMVTGSTYQKTHFFRTAERLDLLTAGLLNGAREAQWELQAWAIFSNHYHLIGVSPAQPDALKKMIGKLHMQTAKAVNRQDHTPRRKVWHQYWDSQITFERSYWARLHYVHQNPVRHGVTAVAENYRWCSAAWFARVAERSFYKSVNNFPFDQLEIADDF